MIPLLSDCGLLHLFPSLDESESWTVKKAEHRRIDAFELWCWRRLLKVPWTARRSNQSILKEISPEYLLEWLDAEAEAPILWPPHVKNWLMEKTLMLGKIEGRRRSRRQRMRCSAGITDWMDMRLPSKLWELVKETGRPCVLQSMGLQRIRHDWATKLNWTM